jgi:hypothetical protein
MPTSTPWGTADQSKKIARGIVFYSTPSHGGYHLSKTLNAQVHPALRREKGWYEEDCEYAIVHFTFPSFFQNPLSDAIHLLKNYWPDAYAAVTGETVKPEESSVLRERIVREKTRDLYVGVACYGDWHERVPAGMVGVCAVRGGRNERGAYASNDQKFFLVPADEYRIVDGVFVVDEAKCKQVEGW